MTTYRLFNPGCPCCSSSGSSGGSSGSGENCGCGNNVRFTFTVSGVTNCFITSPSGLRPISLTGFNRNWTLRGNCNTNNCNYYEELDASSDTCFRDGGGGTTICPDTAGALLYISCDANRNITSVTLNFYVNNSNYQVANYSATNIDCCGKTTFTRTGQICTDWPSTIEVTGICGSGSSGGSSGESSGSSSGFSSGDSSGESSGNSSGNSSGSSGSGSGSGNVVCCSPESIWTVTVPGVTGDGGGEISGCNALSTYTWTLYNTGFNLPGSTWEDPVGGDTPNVDCVANGQGGEARALLMCDPETSTYSLVFYTYPDLIGLASYNLPISEWNCNGCNVMTLSTLQDNCCIFPATANVCRV